MRGRAAIAPLASAHPASERARLAISDTTRWAESAAPSCQPLTWLRCSPAK